MLEADIRGSAGEVNKRPAILFRRAIGIFQSRNGVLRQNGHDNCDQQRGNSDNATNHGNPHIARILADGNHPSAQLAAKFRRNSVRAKKQGKVSNRFERKAFPSSPSCPRGQRLRNRVFVPAVLKCSYVSAGTNRRSQTPGARLTLRCGIGF